MIDSSSYRTSPLRGRYLVEKPVAGLLLCIIDLLCMLPASFRQKKKRSPEFPRRILIANSAHLGDIVLLTSILPVLKSAFPDVRIGLLIGSWSRTVIENHALVDWIHTADHWYLNRSKLSFYQKFKQYRRTRAQALSEIKTVGYDIAIDTYFYFPNFIPLLWRADIPVRIGYTSGGFGPFLTEARTWNDRNWEVIDYHADLLRSLPVNEEHFQKLQPILPPIDDQASRSVAQLLGVDSIDRARYIVIHIGTSQARKEWPAHKWKSLTGKMTSMANRLVFTGAGIKEHELIESVISGLPNCLNVCNRLSWKEFVAVIAHAQALIGVDSVAGHTAAALKVPVVIISHGMNGPYRWKLLSEQSRTIMHAVPCSPCYRSNGCDAMTCLREVEPEEVYRAVREVLKMS
jgi:ADP-heptose:LPS heptosyltransferase